MNASFSGDIYIVTEGNGWIARTHVLDKEAGISA